jgi:integrase
MTCFVFRQKRRVKGKLRIARTFSGKFQLPGDAKPTVVPLGVMLKEVAQKKLREIVRDIERQRAGLTPSKAARDAAKQSVETAIEEYIQSRRGLHCNEKYVRELELKLLRLMRECNWPTLRDITGHSFEAWRARQAQEKKISAKTLNEYRDAIFGLCKWMEPRVGSNPIRLVGRIKSLGDPKQKRRAFTLAELWRLISVGGERGVVYLVAAFTGLRRGELGKIEWRDVHIDESQPYISVRSSIAKNAKAVSQPLPARVAAALRQCRPVDAAPHDLAFKRLIPGMDRFRADLAAADIVFVDDKGQCAHFHSLRKTFATELAKLRLPLRVAMELMRHSDAKLTTKIYTDAGMLPIWDAVGALPMFSDTQIDTLEIVASGQTVSAPVPIEQNSLDSLGAEAEPLSPPESASVPESAKVADGARCRVRTCDLSPRRPLLSEVMS